MIYLLFDWLYVFVCFSSVIDLDSVQVGKPTLLPSFEYQVWELLD